MASIIDKDEIERNVRANFSCDRGFTIDDDGLVNVVRNCVIKVKRLTDNARLPVNFGTVKGNFYIDGQNLKSLEGGPRIVGGDYDCSHNLLTSLVGAPQLVGVINCNDNPLQSLDGLPKSFVSLSISWEPQLPILKLVGKHVNIFDNFLVDDIFRKYIESGSRSNIIQCQKELIQAGFEGNASW